MPSLLYPCQRLPAVPRAVLAEIKQNVTDAEVDNSTGGATATDERLEKVNRHQIKGNQAKELNYR